MNLDTTRYYTIGARQSPRYTYLGAGIWNLLCTIFIMLELVSSFSMLRMMQEYRPPVKSSVKKIYSDRSSARRTVISPSTHHQRSSSMVDKKLQQPLAQQQQDGRRFSSSSSSKSSHSSSYALPTPSRNVQNISCGVQTFERRMRDMVLGTQRQQQQQQQQQHHQHQQQTNAQMVLRQPKQEVFESELPSDKSVAAPSSIRVIQCLQEYKEVVGNELEKLVVVRFYASYCKACKAVAPHFYKMAHEKSQHAVFVDVPLTATNSALHQGLNIPSLPYIHIYHPSAGLVEESSFTRKHVPNVLQKLDFYVDGCCPTIRNEGDRIDQTSQEVDA